MTATNPIIRRVNEPTHVGFRVMMVFLAVLLGLQCVWLLFAEFSRPAIESLPANASDAAAAANQREAALWAASVAAVRGDLWAESAFTYTNLLFDQTAAANNPQLISPIASARLSLDHALRNSPHRSDVWLLLAGIALRLPSGGGDPIEALKMSYYTGPSEQNLLPLRLRIAARADRFDDVQMRDFASREVRALLNRKQNSAVIDAYNAASPAGKLFIAQSVADTDPSLASALRASSAPRQSFPN